MPIILRFQQTGTITQASTERPSIVGYYDGYKITFPVNIDGEFLKQSDYDALQKGDVIQINYDDHGVIRFFRKYDVSKLGFESYTGKSAIFNSAVMKSKVADVISGTPNFGIENNGTITYIMGYYTSPVYLYDRKTQTVTKISTTQICEGDTIVLSCYNYSLQEAVVIR